MLNWVDVVILIVVSISAAFGISRGFVREVLSVLAWIAAIIVGRLYSPHLAPFFTITENETARYALAFAALCLATLIVGGIINHFMARLVSMVGLQMTDRLLGILFGVARGVIIVAIVIYFAASSYSLEIWWQESVAIPYIERVIEWGQSMLGSDPAAV